MTKKITMTAESRREQVDIECDADTLRLARLYASCEAVALADVLGHLVRRQLMGQPRFDSSSR